MVEPKRVSFSRRRRRRSAAPIERSGAISTAPSATEPRMNDRIRAREVRLVDPDGNQLGIKVLPEALQIAKEMDLDLVEVAPLANPPVCRIMDYGKFKFDEAQRQKESRRKGSNTAIKEMKITIMFRGREVFHPELGKRILDKIAEQMDESAKVESEARLDGRNMVMVLAPDKRARQSQADKAEKTQDDTTPTPMPSSAPTRSPAAAPVSTPAAAAAPADVTPAATTATTEAPAPAAE
jgi:translation initiation factor IF-3